MGRQQLLRDPEVQVTEELILSELQATGKSYQTFVKGLKTHDIELLWHYYNDGKAWLAKGLYHWVTPRGTSKEKNIFWFSLWQGAFKVSFYFPVNSQQALVELPLSPTVIERITQAETLGKMKFFPVLFDNDSTAWFPDIFTLIEYKKTLK